MAPTLEVIEPEYPDETTSDLHARWREKLDEAQRRYHENRTDDNLRELLRVLKTFTDVVVRNKRPEE